MWHSTLGNRMTYRAEDTGQENTGAVLVSSHLSLKNKQKKIKQLKNLRKYLNKSLIKNVKEKGKSY